MNSLDSRRAEGARQSAAPQSAVWPGSSVQTLPTDPQGTLVGRVWNPDVNGPSPVVVRAGRVFDISASFPTVRDLCEQEDPGEVAAATSGSFVGTFGLS